MCKSFEKIVTAGELYSSRDSGIMLEETSGKVPDVSGGTVMKPD